MNEDPISRAWLLSKFKNLEQSSGTALERNAYDLAVMLVEDAPSVPPQVAHGRWIWADDGYCRCSNCKQKAPVVYGTLPGNYQNEPITAMTDYCPSCGARMGGEDDAAD